MLKLEENIRRSGFQSVDVAADGNCFYRAIAFLTSGDQSNHRDIRQLVASHIERQGCILGGILEHNKVDFNNYISALCQENN